MKSSLWTITCKNFKTNAVKTRVVEFEGFFPLKHEMDVIEDGDAIENGHNKIISMTRIR